MKKILILSGIGATLICLAGITYYLVMHLPAKQRAELYLQRGNVELEKERQKVQEREEMERKLDECLDREHKSYSERWETSCKSLNIKLDNDGSCSLPSEVANSYEEYFKDSRKECLERYN